MIFSCFGYGCYFHHIGVPVSGRSRACIEKLKLNFEYQEDCSQQAYFTPFTCVFMNSVSCEMRFRGEPLRNHRAGWRVRRRIPAPMENQSDGVMVWAYWCHHSVNSATYGHGSPWWQRDHCNELSCDFRCCLGRWLSGWMAFPVNQGNP